MIYIYYINRMVKYWIMKNIYKIHPLSYVIALIAFFTGQFRNYILFMIIIFIHEAGHIITSCFFKWKIKKIIILPFGCLSIFNEKINKPLYQEFIISIMGIVFQMICLFPFNRYYNYLIIIFNLLPIYPLDGSKILNIFLNYISNFKTSYLYTIYISFIVLIVIFFLVIIYKDLIMFIIFLPLLFNLVKTYKGRKEYINKFYLERYLYNFNFNKNKIIKNIYDMKKDYNHYFLIKNKLIPEKKYLLRYYNKVH